MDDGTYLSGLGEVLGDARQRILAKWPDLRAFDIPFEAMDVQVWPQIYGSTAGPWGGIGGSAMTSFLTVVVECPNWSRDAFVYLAGKFAYAVDARDNEWLRRSIEHRNFPTHPPSTAQSSGKASDRE